MSDLTPPPSTPQPSAPQPVAAPHAQPGYAPPAQAPVYQAPVYAPPAYQPYGQPAPGYAPGYGYAPVRTNPTAIVALVAGIAGFSFVPLIGSIVAVITGHISLRQIPVNREAGRGMALAGVIMGWIGAGLWAALIVSWLFLAGFIVAVSTAGS